MTTVAGGSGGGVVLGLSHGFHDAAAALVVDGEVVAAAEEERFTRSKHDASLAVHAIEACLEVAGLVASDVTDVAFYERPINVATRFLATRQEEGPRSLGSFVRDAPDVLGRNLFTSVAITRALRRLGARRPPTVAYVDHHASHAAAAFLASPFDEAAILTVDGVGEWATASIGHGSGPFFAIDEELRYPSSIGLLYSLVTSWCGFRSNSDEYKVMGLAPYGEPRYRAALDGLLERCDDGSFAVRRRDVRWFSSKALRSPELAERFGGPPRHPDEPVGEREADLAASIQALTEDLVLRLAARAHERSGAAHLCLAGGVALNCVANGRILREGPFEDLWIQPAAGDAGSAVGAALATWHDRPGARRARASTAAGGDAMRGAYLGPTEGSVAEVRAVLDEAGATYRELDDDALVAEVAARLAEGAVVGWCRGHMEFGPRALGNRSILADPRRIELRQRLNRIAKGREDFRPFAPMVLAERASEWFELDHASPYMLVVAPVRAERLVAVGEEPKDLAARAELARSEIPACTHVDGSARIQTVDGVHNPLVRRLLEAFDRITGCPMLVNTSFNRAGEPIVADAAQALATARAAQLDLLVVGPMLVDLGADR